MQQFLIEEYGEKILFSQSHCKNKSLIVLIIDITLTELVERLRQLNDMKNKIHDVTEILKSEVVECDLQSMESYVCDDGVIDKYLNTFELPPTWAYFLQKLLCNKQLFNEQKLVRAKSIFMDVFCYE